MMNRTEFNQLVRNALVNLYDYAALETHPLASVFPTSLNQCKSRAEHLRHTLLYAIEELKPPDREQVTTGAVEWRPYLILYNRYVECLSLQELQTLLALSERQLRREHGRALRAVTARLWDQIFPKDADTDQKAQGSEDTNPQQWRNNFQAFEIDREPLAIAEVVHGVIETLQRRIQNEGVELCSVFPERPFSVLADRVVLRQVLLSLLSYALDVRSDGNITVGTEIQASQVVLWIQYQVDDLLSDRDRSPLDAARYWTQRLGSSLEETPAPDMQTGYVRLALSLPRAGQLTVLVVDDQETAIRMFKRYLSCFNIRVIGVQEPDQVLPLVRQLQPQVITLDVMMPTMDGWEILQALQADPETRHVHVIVCSVWDEPELAFSLGAADFLKKPITQKDLLSALVRLELLDIPAGSCQEDISE